MSDERGEELTAAMIDEGAMHESEGIATQFVSRLDCRDEIDWLASLRAEAPNLLLNFCSGTHNETVRLTEAAFVRRFAWCRARLELRELPAPVVMELFRLAVGQDKLVAAFTKFQQAMEGAEFSNAQAYLKFHKARLDKAKRLLDQDSPAPHKMAEWSQVWMGSLAELIRLISGQLEWQERVLAEQRKFWLTSGQMQIESHLLSVAEPTIRKLLIKHNVSPSCHSVMVAYAHASQLVPYTDSAEGGNHIEAMKNRLHRARKAPRRVQVLSLLFMQLAANA